jgi:hypothetical protein
LTSIRSDRRPSTLFGVRCLVTRIEIGEDADATTSHVPVHVAVNDHEHVTVNVF